MRTFALILILTLSPLAICGVAHATAPTDFSKPVCSHYDDSSKPAAHATVDSAPVATASNNAVASTTMAPTTPSPSAASKGGGTSSMGHPRTAPHWQTFLPGMFR